MKRKIDHYTRLANILDYPDEDFSGNIQETDAFISKHYTSASGEFHSYASHMLTLGMLEQQELFIRTFDVQSLTTLDLGYILFGDDYKRGELLVNLSREHKAVNNDCGTELADYLPNILRLLPKLEDDVFLLELIEHILAPAVNQMIMAFDRDRVAEKEKFYARKDKTIIDRPIRNYTIYQKALKTLLSILRIDFDFRLPESQETDSDFLKNIVIEVSHEGKS